MLSADTIRSLLPCLIGLPLILAVLLPLVGRTARTARSLALAGALIQLLLAGLVVRSVIEPLSKRATTIYTAPKDIKDAVDYQVFVPEFVPGDPGVDKHSAD